MRGGGLHGDLSSNLERANHACGLDVSGSCSTAVGSATAYSPLLLQVFMGTQHTNVIFYYNPIKCLSLWFDGGDVVVVAGYVGFRVHRDVLSENSGVLADMLSGLRAERERYQEELVEGCPVIRLEDSVHDVKHLLRLLYNGIE